MEIYKSLDGTEIAVVAATWEINPRVTFASLAPEFKANPVKAWRNYGSRVGKGGGSPALKDVGVVRAHANVRHPDPWDMTRQKFRPDFRGRRTVDYYMHVDLAKNKDAAGIACVHREKSGVVVVDFMHAHRAEPGKDIQFADIRSLFIYALHERGFTIRRVTFDQWNSVEMRQILEGQGFETDEVSADKKTGPYDTLIEMILTNRLDYYPHPQFLREMEYLQTNGVKYDHPKGGSKDVADAVACATWGAITEELDNPKEPAGVIHVRRQPDTRGNRFKPQYERSAW